MNKELKIELIEKHRNLISGDFDLRIDNDQFGIGLLFTKKTSNVIFRISVWIDKKGSYNKFVPAMNLLILENILQPIIAKYKTFRAPYQENSHVTIALNNVDPEFDLVFPEKTIKDERDIIDLYDNLNKFINQTADPFFAKWSDMKRLNFLVKETPQMELSKKINNGAYQKAVIFKLNQDNSYEEYINWIHNGLIKKAESSDDPVHEIQANIIRDLKIELDNRE